ncbi:MAG TPA: hypothetical protein VL996_13495 [Methylocella sp.]|nr:hypothetical protein [Methylocella sp.]
MKTRILLMSMIFLLPLPSEAREVYVAVVSEDLLHPHRENLPDPANRKELKEYREYLLDYYETITENPNNGFDFYFEDSNTKNLKNLTLQDDQELIISGGRGSIAREMDPYAKSKVIFQRRGKAFACYYERPLGKQNVTFVEIRSDDGAFPQTACSAGVAGPSKEILLKDVSKAVKKMK